MIARKGRLHLSVARADNFRINLHRKDEQEVPPLACKIHFERQSGGKQLTHLIK